MTEAKNHHHDPSEDELPDQLVSDLKRLYQVNFSVHEDVDEKILSAAQRTLEHDDRKTASRSIWKLAAKFAASGAAAAAVIIFVLLVILPRTGDFSSTDIDRSGSVDILDAFTLARRIETGELLKKEWDINGDGTINNLDVDWLAEEAVSVQAVSQ